MIKLKDILGKMVHLSMGHLWLVDAIEELEKIEHESVKELKDIRSKIWDEYFDIFYKMSLADQGELVGLGYYPKLK